MTKPIMTAVAVNTTAKSSTKKDRILTLFQSGVHDATELAVLVNSKPSYVAGILADAGLGVDYSDLYKFGNNAYSKLFEHKLKFKDVQSAKDSVAFLEVLYIQFVESKDVAGQHECEYKALTMHNRARANGKLAEAKVFSAWLKRKLL